MLHVDSVGRDLHQVTWQAHRAGGYTNLLFSLDAGASTQTNIQGSVMLHYAVVFLVIALIAAVLGFGGIAAGAAGIAKILFFVFLVIAIITFFAGRGAPRV